MGFRDWFRKVVIRNVPPTDKTDIVFERIMYGEYILKNPFHQNYVKETLNMLESKVYQAKTHTERVKLLSIHFTGKQMMKYLDQIDTVFEKDDTTAEIFKEKSYKFYKSGNYEMAIRCCNISLMFTPNSSQLLIGTLHADRAILFKAIKDYKYALCDIDVALGLGKDFSNELINKLTKLKSNCSNFRIKHVTLNDVEAIKQKEYRDEIIFKVHGDSNFKIPSAGNYISIVSHPVKGRMIIVTDDVKAGTTVIVEEPYVSILTESVNWELKHCAKCYKKSYALVPCPECVFSAYCTEECRLEDYNLVHKYECPCMNYFHAIRISASLHLSFKAICRAGPNYMFKLYTQQMIGLKRRGKQINGFNPETGLYDSNSYYQIYNMISHRYGQHIHEHTWFAIKITKLLELKTDFFNEIPRDKKLKFSYFIAATFLQHCISIPYNVMGLWEDEKIIKQRNKTNLFGLVFSSKQFGCGVPSNRHAYSPSLLGLYSLCGLMCHSCDPTAVRVNLMNGKLAIITSRNLSAGEELNMSYGYEYSTHSLHERSTLLPIRYNFKCQCIACIYNWPKLNDIIKQKLKHLCPKCTNIFTYNDTNIHNECLLLNYKHSSTKFICGHCKEIYKIMDLKIVLKNYIKYFEQGKKYFNENNYLNAIPIFINCIEYFQKYLLSPSHLLLDSQTLFHCSLDCIATETYDY